MFFNNIIKKEKKPYPFFEIKDFLKVNLYKNLRNDFIDIYRNNQNSNLFKKTEKGISDFKTSYFIGGGKEKDSYETFLSFSEKYKSIKDLLNLTYNQQFVDKIFALLGDKNFFKKNKLRYPNEKLSMLDYIFFNNVYINYKFSFFENNSGLGLHRDHGSKEVALLLYFGFSDNIDRSHGGTQVYHKNDDKVYKDHKIEEKDLTNFLLIHDQKPIQNTLFGFKKTDNSWHGVKRINLPFKVLRLNLQINFMRLDSLKHNSIFYEKLKFKVLNFKLRFYKFINKIG